MQPHQARVVNEKKELDDKLSKLRTFFTGQLFAGLPEDERTRLLRQEKAMHEYSDVLGERIASFPA
jgi:hypothetical protein